MGVVGISLGIVVWAGVALMGLHLILQKMAGCIRSSWSAAAFTCAGWGGSCCVPRGRSKRSRRRRPVALPKAGRSFIRGFLTNLSNPKAVIYFGSVFSLFVGDSVGAGARWGLFLLIVAETFVWFSLVAVVFALPAMRRGYQRLAKWIDGVAGVLFTGFGLHLIFTR